MTHSCVTLWYHPSSTRLLCWTSDDFDLSPWNCLGTRLSRMRLLISSSFGYWSFLVGDAQCSPHPTSSCSRDVLWLNCLHFEPSPSHTWSHWVAGPCSQCVIHYQSAFINASDSCRVTCSVSGCWGSKPSISPTLIQFLFFSLLVYKTYLHSQRVYAPKTTLFLRGI